MRDNEGNWQVIQHNLTCDEGYHIIDSYGFERESEERRNYAVELRDYPG